MENEIKHSIEYINKKTGNKTGFSAPSDYFSNLEDTIAVKLSEEKLNKKNSFKVPNSYFSTIEDTILDKVTSKEKEPKVISFKERMLKMIPIVAAASVVLFIALNSFVFNTAEELTLDSLSEDEIELWFNSKTLSTSEIALVLEDDIIIEHDFSFSTIEDETIEDYINNSIDSTDLLNEIN
jgi:hypothetical protein